MWYDKSELLSYNRVLNMVLSNRGGGKTFHFTRWAIDDFLKTKRQTVWVRRYKTELTNNDGNQGILDNNAFFAAVINEGLYPDVKLEIKGTIGYINDEPAIFFVALSTSRQMKSINFPNVNKIIFDEFIIGEGRVSYLKNEVEVFLDLFETVARLRDNVRAVLLANSVTVVNPYFLFFNMRVDRSQRFTVAGEVCVELFTDETFIAEKQKTRFGKLVAGTRYGNYAIKNEWLQDSETFIERRTPRSEFMCALKYNGTFYGFWIDYNVGLIYVNRQYDPSSYSLYCLQRDEHDLNLLLIKSLAENRHLKKIVFAFRNGLVRFEDMVVKNQFYEYIGLFVR